MPPRRKKFQVPRKTTSSEAPPRRVVTPPAPPPGRPRSAGAQAPTPNRAASRPLTAEQQAAVDAPLTEPLAIVAGAGSGKTETLTRRVARAVAEGARPASVLVLTFSNKAARELLERLRGLNCGGVEVRTFHGFSLRLLRRFGDEANLGRDFVILGDSQQKALVKKCCQEITRDEDENDVRRAWALIKRARSRGVSSNDLDGSVGAIFRLYRLKLRAMRAVDFDDVVDAAAFACSQQGRCGAFVRSRYTQGFVDEWQDTSRNQLALLASIFAGDRAPLTVVGDDDQAIYGWRDALPAAFDAFRRVFEGASVLPLTRNYRSGGHVVAAARAVVRKVAGRVDKDLWTARSDGEPVAVLRVEGGPQAEARVVARRIQRLLSKCRPKDVAVLCRSASPALRLVEKRLTELHIKCRVVGGQRFFERPVVHAALSYLRLARNELDDAAAETVLLQRPGLGPKTLDRIRSDLPLLGACRAALESSLNEKTRTAINDVLSALDRIHDTLHTSPRPLRSALKLLDPLIIPPAQEPGDEGVDGEKAKKRRGERAVAVDLLEQLRRLAAQKEDESTENEGPSLLREFLDTCALDAGDGDDDSDEVSLTTIHRAKGLEWPHVLLVRANDGVLPASARASDAADGCDAKAARALAPRDDAKRLEEERRLFHVAITRARESFVVTHATRELEGDGEARPSPFLKDLPAACVRRETVSSETASPPPPPRRPGPPLKGPPVPSFQTAASITAAAPAPAPPPPPPPEPTPPPRVRCRVHRVACVRREDGSHVCALPAELACGFVLGPGETAPDPVLYPASLSSRGYRSHHHCHTQARGRITTFFQPRVPPATPSAPPPRQSLLSPATTTSRGSASAFLPPAPSPAAAFPEAAASPLPAPEPPSTQDFVDCLDDFEARQSAADAASDDDGDLTQPYVPPSSAAFELRPAPAGHLCPHGNGPGCAGCAARQRGDAVVAAPAPRRRSFACRDVNDRDVNAAPPPVVAKAAPPAPALPPRPAEPPAPAEPVAPPAPSPAPPLPVEPPRPLESPPQAEPAEPPAPARVERPAQAESPAPAGAAAPVEPPADDAWAPHRKAAREGGFYEVCPDFDAQLQFALDNAQEGDLDGMEAAAAATTDARERAVYAYIVAAVRALAVPAEPAAPAAPPLPIDPPAEPAEPPAPLAAPAEEAPAPVPPSPPPECAICLGEIDDGAQVLRCGHTFHSECIGELADHAPMAAPTRRSLQVSCPLCRNVAREPAPAPKEDDEADLICRPRKVPKKRRRRAPKPPPEPPGAKKKRAHEKIAPYRNDFWAHLNGAIEKKKSQKPRKKKKPDLVPGQTFLNFAPRPPPPPGPPPPEDSPPPPPPPEVIDVDADLTQD